MSSTREITASTQPPKYAAATPSMPPITMPMGVTERLISNVTWPPYTSWEKMSTPCTFVPSRCPGENGASLL